LRVKEKARLGKWNWSSYAAAPGLEALPKFLTVDWLLSRLGQHMSQAQARYRQFVQEGLDDRPWDKVRGQIYLGSEEFIEKHAGKDETQLAEVPRVQRQAIRPALEALMNKKRKSSIETPYRNYG